MRKQDIHQLDTGVVAAFQRLKHSGIGIATHLRAAIGICGAAAQTDNSTAKGIHIRTGGTVIPCFQNRLGDPFYQQRQHIVVADDLRIVADGSGLDILPVSRQFAFQQSTEIMSHLQLIADIALFPTGVNRAGVGMDGGNDDFIRIQVSRVFCQALSDFFQEAVADTHQVSADQHHLLAAGFHSHSGSGQRLFYILGNTLCELACQGNFLIGGDAYLRPANLQLAHKTLSFLW